MTARRSKAMASAEKRIIVLPERKWKPRFPGVERIGQAGSAFVSPDALLMVIL